MSIFQSFSLQSAYLKTQMLCHSVDGEIVLLVVYYVSVHYIKHPSSDVWIVLW